MVGRPGAAAAAADLVATGGDSDNDDTDGVRLSLDEVDRRSREPAGVDADESGGGGG